jgi:hypothetical protein
VLKTRATLLNLHLLVRDRASQARQGLLELDIVLANILGGPLLESVSGIPVLLLQVLEAIVVLQGLPKELPRVRGLGTAVSRLPRLVHIGPQGPWDHPPNRRMPVGYNPHLGRYTSSPQ